MLSVIDYVEKAVVGQCVKYDPIFKVKKCNKKAQENTQRIQTG